MDAVTKFSQSYVPVPESGCWLWTGYVGSEGYGLLTASGKTHRAHRLSYEIYVGPIPIGLLICHKCDTPSCVNPSHLYAGTHRDNVLDMVRRKRHPMQQGTHCRRGHPFLESVVGERNCQGRRYRTCRVCAASVAKTKRRRAVIRKQLALLDQLDLSTAEALKWRKPNGESTRWHVVARGSNETACKKSMGISRHEERANLSAASCERCLIAIGRLDRVTKPPRPRGSVKGAGKPNPDAAA